MNTAKPLDLSTVPGAIDQPTLREPHMGKKTSPRRERGIVAIYAIALMTILIGFVGFAVDIGRIQVAKTQAQSVADAAALYAADGLVGGTPTSAANRAVTSAAENKVDGTSVIVNSSQDVAFGVWDSASNTFLPLTGSAESGATAVQVTVHCSKSRGTAIPTSFAGLFGVMSVDISRSAIATIGVVTSNSVPGVACPWLAGMPNGSTVAATGGNPTAADAPDNSPVLFPASGGTTYRFAGAGGSTTWDPGAGTGAAGADGDSTYIAAQDSTNGINTSKIPLNAMVGIFLDNSTPSSSAAAAALDFSTASSRDFTTLSPGLKQVFFIGDGVNSSGTLQSFVAPTGATRLYIGVMDEKGWWWDNVGSLQFTSVTGTGAVLVQ